MSTRDSQAKPAAGRGAGRRAATPTTLTLALALGLAACSDGTRDVAGTGRFIRFTVGGVISDPFSMDLDLFSAHVLDGSGTDFSTVPGYGGFGYFLIPGVPEGSYYLRRQDPSGFALFIVTGASDIDLSRAVVGRGDYVVPTATTTLDLSLLGLTPWQPDDTLELFSTNLGLVLFGLEGFGADTPTTGATAARFVVDFAQNQLPLIEAPSNDRVSVLHLTSRTSPEGVPYAAVGDVLNAGAFTMVEGTVTTTTVTAAAVMATRSVRVDWKGTAFEPQRSAMSPDGVSAGLTFSVEVLPRAADFGDYASGPDLVLATSPSMLDVSASLAFGDPFPADTFGEVAVSEYAVAATYQADGATRGATVFARLRSADLFASLGATPSIEPKLSPPRAPTIGGEDAFVSRSGVGLMPKLAWSAPAIGTPTGYGVTLYRIYPAATAGGPRRTIVEPTALILTAATEVVVPPVVLATGEQYFARVQAFDERSRDLQQAPFREQLPNASADCLTAVFEP